MPRLVYWLIFILFAFSCTPQEGGNSDQKVSVEDFAKGNAISLSASNGGFLGEFAPNSGEFQFSITLSNNTDTEIRSINVSKFTNSNIKWRVAPGALKGVFPGHGSTCSNNLTAKQVCQLELTYQTNKTGTTTENIELSGTTITGLVSKKISITGVTGDGASLNPSASGFNFGEFDRFGLKQTSFGDTFTITNIGGLTARNVSLSFTGPSPLPSQYSFLSNCPTEISVGQSCFISIFLNTAQGYGAFGTPSASVDQDFVISYQPFLGASIVNNTLSMRSTATDLFADFEFSKNSYLFVTDPVLGGEQRSYPVSIKNKGNFRGQTQSVVVSWGGTDLTSCTSAGAPGAVNCVFLAPQQHFTISDPNSCLFGVDIEAQAECDFFIDVSNGIQQNFEYEAPDNVVVTYNFSNNADNDLGAAPTSTKADVYVELQNNGQLRAGTFYDQYNDVTLGHPVGIVEIPLYSDANRIFQSMIWSYKNTGETEIQIGAVSITDITSPGRNLIAEGAVEVQIDNCSNKTILPGKICSITLGITLSPSLGTSLNLGLDLPYTVTELTGSNFNTSAPVTFNGNGTFETLTLLDGGGDPTSSHTLDFGDRYLGTLSTQSFDIKNIGPNAQDLTTFLADLTTIFLSPYTLDSHTCPASLGAGLSCTIVVRAQFPNIPAGDMNSGINAYVDEYKRDLPADFDCGLYVPSCLPTRITSFSFGNLTKNMKVLRRKGIVPINTAPTYDTYIFRTSDSNVYFDINGGGVAKKNQSYNTTNCGSDYCLYVTSQDFSFDLELLGDETLSGAKNVTITKPGGAPAGLQMYVGDNTTPVTFTANQYSFPETDFNAGKVRLFFKYSGTAALNEAFTITYDRLDITNPVVDETHSRTISLITPTLTDHSACNPHVDDDTGLFTNTYDLQKIILDPVPTPHAATLTTISGNEFAKEIDLMNVAGCGTLHKILLQFPGDIKRNLQAVVGEVTTDTNLANPLLTFQIPDNTEFLNGGSFFLKLVFGDGAFNAGTGEYDEYIEKIVPFSLASSDESNFINCVQGVLSGDCNPADTKLAKINTFEPKRPAFDLQLNAQAATIQNNRTNNLFMNVSMDPAFITFLSGTYKIVPTVGSSVIDAIAYSSIAYPAHGDPDACNVLDLKTGNGADGTCKLQIDLTTNNLTGLVDEETREFKPNAGAIMVNFEIQKISDSSVVKNIELPLIFDGDFLFESTPVTYDGTIPTLTMQQGSLTLSACGFAGHEKIRVYYSELSDDLNSNQNKLLKATKYLESTNANPTLDCANLTMVNEDGDPPSFLPEKYLYSKVVPMREGMVAKLGAPETPTILYLPSNDTFIFTDFDSNGTGEGRVFLLDGSPTDDFLTHSEAVSFCSDKTIAVEKDGIQSNIPMNLISASDIPYVSPFEIALWLTDFVDPVTANYTPFQLPNEMIFNSGICNNCRAYGLMIEEGSSIDQLMQSLAGGDPFNLAVRPPNYDPTTPVYVFDNDETTVGRAQCSLEL